MLGTTVGNLRIISELGQGGMGVVYLAEHTRLGKRFAVKRLLPELTRDARFRKRFDQEARNQASLDHPNIVQVTDFIEQDGQFFLVMEYVDGESLDKRIKRKGPLSDKEAIPILRDVLKALSYAHGKKMIHRDVKPSNIMIDATGRARIMDFGIAVLVGEERLTVTGSDIGSPWYMSPEQIQQPSAIDPRSDLYAVGIVAYEMLTGDVPFDGETDFSVKTQQLQSPVPDPVKRNPQLARELADVILKALRKDPDRRFRTARDFLGAIEKYEIGQVGPEPKRPRLPIRYAAAVAVVAVVSLAVWLFVSGRDDDLSEYLTELGYETNPGFTPTVTPGNILQTKELAPNGDERPLPAPIVFAWREDCFPDQTPRRTPFPFPEESGRLSGSLTLDPGLIGELIPALQIDGGIVADYRLQLENPQVYTFAKSDLSRHFSAHCVQALKRALEDGDQIEWFSVVIQSILADGATWYTHWKAGVTVEARAAQEDVIKAVLGDADAEVVTENTEKTVIKVGTPIVLAYRSRPLQPVFADAATGAQMQPEPGEADTSANIRELYHKKQSPEELTNRVGRIAVTLVDGERERDVRLDHTFHVGDRIRFKISSNRDGWLYVLNRTPNSELRHLWPQENNGRPVENAVTAHEDFVVPPAPGVFKFDEETGTEQLYVVIRSERRTPELVAIRPHPERPDPQQTSLEPQALRIPEQRKVNFAVRGIGESSTIPARGIVFVPGPEAPDPHLYFAADCAQDRACDILWEFKLRHER